MIPESLPLEEDGSIDILRLHSLDDAAARSLLKTLEDIVPYIKHPVGKFRVPNGTELSDFIATQKGWTKYRDWSKKIAVFVALQSVREQLLRSGRVKSLNALPSARKESAEKRARIKPDKYRAAKEKVQEDAERRGKTKYTNKMLYQELGVSRETLRLYELKQKN